MKPREDHPFGFGKLPSDLVDRFGNNWNVFTPQTRKRIKSAIESGEITPPLQQEYGFVDQQEAQAVFRQLEIQWKDQFGDRIVFATTPN